MPMDSRSAEMQTIRMHIIVPTASFPEERFESIETILEGSPSEVRERLVGFRHAVCLLADGYRLAFSTCRIE